MRNMATSSQEQSAGITQLNTALTQMDQVTQTNAASAEETASVTVQLDQQAIKLHKMVDELSGILGIEATNTLSSRHQVQPARMTADEEAWEFDDSQRSSNTFSTTFNN